jgi:hypothetical protein
MSKQFMTGTKTGIIYFLWHLQTFPFTSIYPSVPLQRVSIVQDALCIKPPPDTVTVPFNLDTLELSVSGVNNARDLCQLYNQYHTCWRLF